MNWDDPAERLRLAERVGPDGYNKAILAHHRATTVSTVNGHAIRPVNSRFGRLFMVGNTGTAYRTIEEAEAFARKNPAISG